MCCGMRFFNHGSVYRDGAVGGFKRRVEQGKVERATAGAIVAMYSSMVSRVLEFVNLSVRSSSMRHWDTMRMRTSAGISSSCLRGAARAGESFRRSIAVKRWDDGEESGMKKAIFTVSSTAAA